MTDSNGDEVLRRFKKANDLTIDPEDPDKTTDLLVNFDWMQKESDFSFNEKVKMDPCGRYVTYTEQTIGDWKMFKLFDLK